MISYDLLFISDELANNLFKSDVKYLIHQCSWLIMTFISNFLPLIFHVPTFSLFFCPVNLFPSFSSFIVLLVLYFSFLFPFLSLFFVFFPTPWLSHPHHRQYSYICVLIILKRGSTNGWNQGGLYQIKKQKTHPTPF